MIYDKETLFPYNYFLESTKPRMCRMIIYRSLPITLLLAFSSLSWASSGDIDSRIAASNAAIQSFASSLQTELMTAMQQGGPTEAINVCQQRAPAIAAEIAAETGWAVGRTSLGFRNPGNAPDEWERNVLEGFDNAVARGEPASALSHHEVIENDSGKHFRFMRAIPTAGLCLTCHGSELPNEVTFALERLYPDDRATGYSEGQVRGAFSIIQRM